MTEVLLFHHAQGLTPGVVALADEWRAAGHTVHTPDLFEGRIFDHFADGLRHVEEVGVVPLIERGRSVAEALPTTLVYVGISFGVMPAQVLAQTRAGARGALLLEACLRATEFGPAWPAGVPVQIHGMDADPFFAGEGDIDAARALVEGSGGAELFVYPGNRHLFTDGSLPTHDPGAAAQVRRRALDFLAEVG